MNKKALVLTYHVKNCTRVGGFHHFIRFIIEENYDIDWVSLPVSSTWIFKGNDRENIRNFIDLIKGIEYCEQNSKIRNFTIPIWLPAKVAQILNLQLGEAYWPKWSKIHKKLGGNYDVILIEGVACQYIDELISDYPNSRIIYRPSDVLATFSNVKNAEMLEINTISKANETLCVDESQLNYYLSYGADVNKIRILRNPLATSGDIVHLENFVVPSNNRKKAVFIGVSFVDISAIEFAAEKNKNCDFIIIGPFRKKSYGNIKYMGSLKKEEFENYLREADIGLAPLVLDEYKEKNNIRYGYTGKILSYMKYLLPIVATCSNNYLNIAGFYCVNSKEEFSDKISELLKQKEGFREGLREEYIYAMKVFSEAESKKHFIEFLEL